MRILLVHPGPDFSVHDVLTGWHEALQELGVQVEVYNFNDRLIFYNNVMVHTHERDETGHPIGRALTQDQVFGMSMEGLPATLWTYGPDVVIFVSAFFTTAAMFRAIRAHGHKLVLLLTESPYQDDEQLMRAQLADLVLLNDPCNLESFKALGVPAHYQPHCYRPAVHHPREGPVNPELASDLVFVGTKFASREEFFGRLDLDGLDVLLAGNDWGKLDAAHPLAKYVGTGVGTEADCIYNHEAAELYRNGKAGINFYRREGEDTHAADPAVAMGPREIEMAACQLPFARDPRPEGDEVLHMLPRFTSPGEAGEQIRWLIRHDREREKLAVRAREAIEDRTFTASARRLLTMLDGL